jgi:beta-mannosidase
MSETVELTRWQVAKYPPPADSSGGEPELVGLDWITAVVPGAVNYDISAAGGPNPFASSAQAAASQWVAESDWVYVSTLDTSGQLAEPLAVELDGVDTYSDVWLNGTLLGTTANAYRSYRFDVPAGLLSGTDDRLVVHVKSHFRMIADRLPEARRRIAVQGGHEYRMVKSLVRRYQRNSYSNSSLLNLGVHVLGIGIYKPVRLVSGAGLRLKPTHTVVESISTQRARLRVEVAVAASDGQPKPGAALRAEVDLTDPVSGDIVASGSTLLEGGQVSIALDVTEPRLWWPKGYGEPFLYGLTTRVVRGDDEVIDARSSKVGIRTVDVVREVDGHPTFHLRVNGRRVYVRGTNFVAVDYLKVHGDWDVYERLLALIDNGGYNLVRLWGGGAIEPDAFFTRCDELGIMLWQDLFLHSNTYPDYDEAFVAEFRAESQELLVRMREHTSLVLVCGGNEQQEGWDEWNWQLDIDRFYGAELAFGVGAEVSAELCPELPFIGNSPHGGPTAQSPVAGDTHTWGNFFNATKDPQFVTETCWTQESYSRPQTLQESMGLDVDSFTERHWPARWTELTGRAVLSKFPYSACNGFTTLREYLTSLEVEQAMADYHALSMLRLRSSSCSGIVYWSLNKGGPLFQFGSVDYHGRPLMSYYVIKRAFAEVAINAYRDIDDITVVASNATGEPVDAVLYVRHLGSNGEVIDEQTHQVSVAPDRIARLLVLPGHYRTVRDRTRELVHVELVAGDQVLSTDTLFFCPLSEVETTGMPEVLAADAVAEKRWVIRLSSEVPVKWLMLESASALMFSDNYFTVVPGREYSVEITLLGAAGEAPTSVSIAALDGVGEQLIELPRFAASGTGVGINAKAS